MGCPDRTIEKQGAGAAHMKNPTLAVEVYRATKRGAGDLPVSIKTRIGYNKNEIDTWIPTLLALKPAVLTIHARTRKEMSKVPARWEHVAEIVRLRDEIQKDDAHKTLIFGNGDLTSVTQAHQKIQETGADGAMLGRAIFGNPWLFNSEVIHEVTMKERLQVLCEHTQLFESLLPVKNFALMKKHYKSYITDFEGARELRMVLMEQESSEAVLQVVNRFVENHNIHTE
jgi:tRNA-dihydrouridine synthase